MKKLHPPHAETSSGDAETSSVDAVFASPHAETASVYFFGRLEKFSGCNQTFCQINCQTNLLIFYQTKHLIDGQIVWGKIATVGHNTQAAKFALDRHLTGSHPEGGFCIV